jgi:hypothetical protein
MMVMPFEVMAPEQAEIRSLKGQVKRLKMEREI